MTKRSENRKIEEWENKWDLALIEFSKWWAKVWKEVKKDFKYMLNWYLFYKPTDKQDRYWHLLEVVIVDIILLKVFNLI
jgi:hypothetical protein